MLTLIDSVGSGPTLFEYVFDQLKHSVIMIKSAGQIEGQLKQFFMVAEYLG